MNDDLLVQIDTYLDAVARAATRGEEIGPFTLFVNEGEGWPYYARPTPGATTFTAHDVRMVRERQRALGLPEQFEWVVDTTPKASHAIAAGGLRVTERALMIAGSTPERTEVSVRFLEPDDDLTTVMAVQHVGFASPGTAVGEHGTDDLAHAAAAVDGASVTAMRRRLVDGRTVLAAVWVDGHPVAAGAHQPVGQASEVVGVATLPAYRRRGLATALTAALVGDARLRGIDLVLLSAGDDDIAHVYVRAGFSRIGTFADAEPASS